MLFAYFLIYLLIYWQKAVNALSQFEQPSSLSAAEKVEAAKKIETAIKPLKKRIINGFLQHKDKDVRLLVAICISEIFRILAPEPPFEDRHMEVNSLSRYELLAAS